MSMDTYLLIVNYGTDATIKTVVDTFKHMVSSWARLSSTTYAGKSSGLSPAKLRDLMHEKLERDGVDARFAILDITASAWAAYSWSPEVVAWMKDR